MNEVMLLDQRPIPTMPDRWDYDASVKRVAFLVFKWENITTAILNELWIAHEVLSSPGARTDLVANATKLQTWETYCDDIGINKTTAWRWFKKAGFIKKELEETPELPESKYRVIYADPPWKYTSGDQHSREEQKTVLSNHYPSMTIEELCDLEVGSLAAADAVLFLWTTSPLLEESFEVINAWGFNYKTNIVWDKVKHNVGHYVSVRCEHLLICTRGSCTPDSPRLYDNVVSIERTGHSEKPEYFRQLIDELYPNGNRIELFARGIVPGNWDAWGNEAKQALAG